MPHSAIERRTRKQAQSLRRRPTDAERKLWNVLRSLKSLGVHFRRQAPIGPYIVDFVFHSRKLVIEVDGGQHAELTRLRDAKGTAWLELQGFQILRFWNNDVLRTPDTVGEMILAALDQEKPHPRPLPTRGRGEELPAISSDRSIAGEASRNNMKVK